MFQSPILHMSVPNWEEKKPKLLELSKLQNFTYPSSAPEINHSVNTTFFYANENHGKKDDLALRLEIANILKDEIEAFEDTFELNFKEIDMAWFQTEEQNMFHGIHNHGYGTFSVVCYLDYNPEVHRPIYFLSPYNNLFTGEVDLYTPPYLDEGSIIFFPSSVNHFTEPNKSKVKRNILSFNINFEWRPRDLNA
jgi:hypothetical protein